MFKPFNWHHAGMTTISYFKHASTYTHTYHNMCIHNCFEAPNITKLVGNVFLYDTANQQYGEHRYIIQIKILQKIEERIQHEGYFNVVHDDVIYNIDTTISDAFRWLPCSIHGDTDEAIQKRLSSSPTYETALNIELYAKNIPISILKTAFMVVSLEI
jgi:hypothetical protein